MKGDSHPPCLLETCKPLLAVSLPHACKLGRVWHVALEPRRHKTELNPALEKPEHARLVGHPYGRKRREGSNGNKLCFYHLEGQEVSHSRELRRCCRRRLGHCHLQLTPQSISGKGGEDRRVCCLGSEAKGERDSGSRWGSKELSGPQRLLTARLYLIQTPVKYSSSLLLFFIF